jgi:hypothetical protein
MSISITFSGPDHADLATQAAAFFGTVAAPAAETKVTTGRGKGNGKAAEDKGSDDAPTGPTVEEIRELAGKIETDDDQDKAIAIISDAGAESISGLEKKSAKVRQTVFDAIKEIVEKAAAKGKRKALD